MDYKKRIGQGIATLLLIAALMLPTAIAFIHMFDGHEHITCNDRNTHFHQSIEKCEICHLYMATISYDIADVYTSLLLHKIPVKVDQVNITLQFHSLTIINTQLRAPPIFV